MPRLPLCAVFALFASTAVAQNADLTLRLNPDSRYNAGELATVRATVTNLGPDDATAAGVRLAKPFKRFVPTGASGCVEIVDDVLCNTPALKAGESRDFLIPFFPPPNAGTMHLSARTESFTVDPNHDNDAATADVEVVKLPDLSLTLDIQPGLRTQQASSVFILIRNQAAFRPDSGTLFVTFPDPLQVTDTSSRTCEAFDARTYRCSFQGPDPETGVIFLFSIVPSHSAPSVTVTASVETPLPDWNPDDNRASKTAGVFDVPTLDVHISAADAVDANNRAIATYEFMNATDFPATNVFAEIITNPGTPEPVTNGEWTCRQSTNFRLECSNPLIPPHATSTLRVPVQYPSKYFRGTLGTNYSQKPAPDFRDQFRSLFIDAVFYKPFEVTTNADSGSGSLRQAIFNANAECSNEDGALPCKIQFASGAFTIQPASALPLITVTDFAIDGENRVVLDGSKAGDADGLYLYNAAAVVRGMKIVNFAKNGILSITHQLPFLTRHHVVEHNELSGNGLRGLMAYTYSGEITDNVIAGNARSGIFLLDQSTATIRDNRIERNRASGIYLGGASDVVIEGNVVADGAAFGIAIDRGARAQIFENRIVGNVQPGIDLQLDGPSLGGAPVITSARFDPSTGETVIEGSTVIADNPYPVTITSYLYANSTDEAGGDIFLGSVRADRNRHFTLRYKGDLTGKYIDGTNVIVTDFGDFILRTSSEFGPRTAAQ